MLRKRLCILLLITSSLAFITSIYVLIYSNKYLTTSYGATLESASPSYEGFLMNINSHSSKNQTFLCLVMTRPSSGDNQQAIIDTWGLSCNDLIFLFGNHSSAEFILQERRPHIYNLLMNVTDEYDNTWMKIRAGFTFVNNKWTKEFDWIIRIDDDAYLIFENLLKLLAPYQPTIPVQFGCHLARYLGGYIPTGAGIVLSRAAYKSLMNVFFNGLLCNTTYRTHEDDVFLGTCLKSAGVPFGDSSDGGALEKRPKFIMPNLYELVHNPLEIHSDFFRNESAYSVGKGFDCCAEDLIGLHYLQVTDIHRIHHLIQSNPDKRKNARLLVHGISARHKV